VLKYLSTTHGPVWEVGGVVPPFLSSAQDGGKWSGSWPGRFTPRERVPPHAIQIRWDVGWTPQPVWTLWSREKSLASAGNRTSAVQLVARSYTDWAILPIYSFLKKQILNYWTIKVRKLKDLMSQTFFILMVAMTPHDKSFKYQSIYGLYRLWLPGDESVVRTSSGFLAAGPERQNGRWKGKINLRFSLKWKFLLWSCRLWHRVVW
jgi:hypothetical protein